MDNYQHNQNGNTENVLEKKPVNKLLVKKQKLAKQIAAAVEKRKAEEAREKELLAQIEKEESAELIKILRKAIANGKYLGDIDKEVKALIS